MIKDCALEAVVQYLTLTSNFSGRLKQYFSGIGAFLCHRFYCFLSQLCEPFSDVLLGPFEAIAWRFKHAMPKFPLTST